MRSDDHGTPGFEQTYRAHRLALVGLAFLRVWFSCLSEDPLAYLKHGVVNLAKDGQRRDGRRRCSALPAVHYS